MKQDKRKSLKLALATSVLSRWATPSIMAVSTLPAHAQTSICDPRDPIVYEGFIPSNIQCVVGSPNRVTFDLLNNDVSTLTFNVLDVSDGSQIHISPPLPFNLAFGETVGVVVESSQNNVDNCPNLQFLTYLVGNEDGCVGVVPINL